MIHHTFTLEEEKLILCSVKGKGYPLKKNSNDPLRMVGLAGTLGFEILIFIFGGTWIGKKLDAAFGTAPLWIAVGVIGGIIIGILSAFLTLKSFIKD